MTTNLFSEIQTIIADHLGIDRSVIVPQARFREDLEADSLDLVELTMMFEEVYEIEIADEEAQKVVTVGDAVQLIQTLTDLKRAWPEPVIQRAPSRFDYDIAISYASEDKDVAEKIYYHLSREGIRVFYDRNADVQASLWGKDLYGYFAELYSKRARYCLVLISSHYARKAWTRHELRAAQERALKESVESREYILPLRLDDTELTGVFSTTGYVDWRETPQDLIMYYLRRKLQS
ncbi:MAG: acyl carrier protein [Candidatus Micrarchaeaceae archaeon]